jgi:uncharacterized protein
VARRHGRFHQEAAVSGVVVELYRYPVKSFQGHREDTVQVGPTGIEGDRRWGLVDVATGRLASAKRFATLLEGTGEDDAVVLPDGERVDLTDADAGARLSQWLGRELRPVRAGTGGPLSYQMTFDPPNDEAELVDIPVPEGTLLDLAAVHLVSATTLDHCRRQRPELDWDVRRFRPNLVVDPDEPAFAEEGWRGREVIVGGAVLRVLFPTVRCAMPLRAQPGGLERQPALFRAMSDLNTASPNHLGVYLGVVEPGPVRTGDPVIFR